jgi:hypothetical protein
MAEIEVNRTVNVVLHLTEHDAQMLKALCQNPHDNYRDNKDLMFFAEQIFHELRSQGIQ